MPEVFADTGYWTALLNKRDSLNTRARELSSVFQDATIVTTEMALTELLNHASTVDNEKRRVTAEGVLAMAQDLLKSGSELPALMTAVR